MFIGHFAAGFAAKRLAPRVSLGTLFLAAQFVDLLWPTLLMFGVERARIAPGATPAVPLVFEHYPISHSLLMVLVWGLVLGAAHFAWKRDVRSAVVLGLAVLSHWLLDLIVHVPDLPLAPGAGPKFGLGLWHSVSATLVVEFSLFAAGLWLYTRTTKAADATGRRAFWSLVAFLALIHVANLFGDPPPNIAALAWVGQAQWLLVLWGYWVDRHRQHVA